MSPPRELSRYLILPLIAVFLSSCETAFTPKPKGYFKIELPPKSYAKYESPYCPFIFETPEYSQVIRDTVFFDTIPHNPCWLTINYGDLKGTLYLSYMEINTRDDLARMVDEAHILTSKHIVKAEAIDEIMISTENNVHGIVYEVSGEAASALQFYLTDSVHHFIRCALYFYSVPNEDSLRPVTAFLKEDAMHMIKTLEWK